MFSFAVLVESIGRPCFIIAVSVVALSASEQMAGRAISLARSGQVGPVGFLPGLAERCCLGGWNLITLVVQPGMPFRGHRGGLRIAFVHHPSALQSVPLARPGSVIDVAERILPHPVLSA